MNTSNTQITYRCASQTIMCRNPLGIKQKCKLGGGKSQQGLGGPRLCLSNKDPDFSGPFEYILNSKAAVLNLLDLKLALSKRAFVYVIYRECPGGSHGKQSACNAGGQSLIPGWGRSPGEGNGYPLQYSCLENPMDRGDWWATVHGLQRVRQDSFLLTVMWQHAWAGSLRENGYMCTHGGVPLLAT